MLFAFFVAGVHVRPLDAIAIPYNTHISNTLFWCANWPFVSKPKRGTDMHCIFTHLPNVICMVLPHMLYVCLFKTWLLREPQIVLLKWSLTTEHVEKIVIVKHANMSARCSYLACRVVRPPTAERANKLNVNVCAWRVRDSAYTCILSTDYM